MSIQWKSLLLIALFFSARLDASLVDEFRSLHQKNAAISDYDEIETKLFKELPSERSLLHFAFGKLHFQAGNQEKAQQHFSESLRLGTSLDQIASLDLARSYIATDKIPAAKVELNKVIQKRSYLKKQAQLELAGIHMKNGHHISARRLYRYLERRMRRDERYPEILWNLAKIELNSKRSYRACRWVRKLYSRKPEYEKLAHWSLDPKSIQIGDRKVNCNISRSHKKKRIRRFILAGMSDRAKKEIDDYVEKYRNKYTYESHLLSAYYLVQEGYPKEAFQILLPYYPSYQNDLDFLTQFAKASVRAGEYQAAVGAYYKAHSIRQRSRQGRFALYQAAFLSYQFQDYDGATRKFEEFVKKYRRSGLARQARQHLAWLKYLKKDYEGALAAYKDLRRYGYIGRSKQTKYWKAMSYYHLDDKEQAKKILNSLINEKSPTYYSVLAKARLLEMGESIVERQLAQADEESEAEILNNNDGIVSEAEESEETVAKMEELLEKEEEAKEDAADAALDPVAEPNGLAVLKAPEDKKVEDVILVEEFSTSSANKAFRRADDLIRLGFFDLARWELFQVEKYAKKDNERKKLIQQYEKIQAYHRSLHIAHHRFIRDRIKYGIDGVSGLWKSAYPQAFKDVVEKEASRKDLDPYFVWSIMRAESHFRVDAESPVGAQGLMQLMPYTAVKIAKKAGEPSPSVGDLRKPAVNISLGTAYLNRLMNIFNRSMPLVAAGYNAGPHRVKTWAKNFGNLSFDEFIEHIPFVETRNYVKKAIKNHYIYHRLYEKPKADAYVWLTKNLPYSFDGPAPARENWQ
tara:strand:- start:4700 stop:7111 length:2412 start_codon:yes stop_codon:yes gene_type:complete